MKIGVASTDIGVLEDPEDPTKAYTFPGGSFWYRISQPLNYLGMRETTPVGRLTHNGEVLGIETYETGEKHFDCDVIILQRCMWESLPDAIYRARSNGQVVINDIDDWFDGLPPSNIAFKATAVSADASLNRDIYKKVLGASSALICSTPFLVEQYSRFRRPTYLWRNSIDFDSFPLRREQQTHPMYGWLGNLGYRAKDTEILKGIIGSFVRDHNVMFHHVGHLPARPDIKGVAERMGIDPGSVVLSDSVSFIMLSLELPKAFDVGVVPLEPIRFNDAKSCLKGMEYIASGIPFVASPSQEYQWLESHGIGRVARKPLQWKKHLIELLDLDVRVAEAERNLVLLRPLVDIQGTKGEWEKILLETTP